MRTTKAASQLPGLLVADEVPLPIRITSVLGFVVAGLGIAALFRAGLGDATW